MGGRGALPAQTNGNGALSRLACDYRYAPTATLSGDFIQLLRHEDNNSLGILLYDVMGHGVRSALITALIRALVERLIPLHNQPGARHCLEWAG